MATYYISPTGNDTTGNGTVGNPWAKYSKFYSSSTTGDTCVMAAGTYTYEVLNIINRHLIGAALDQFGKPTSIYDGASATFGQSWLRGTASLKQVMFRNIVVSANNSFFQYGYPGVTTDVDVTDVVGYNLTWPTANGSGIFHAGYDFGATTADFLRVLLYNITTTGTNNDCAVWRNSGTSNPQTLSMTNCTTITNKTASSLTILFAQQSANTQWTLKNNIFVETGGLAPSPNLTTTYINTANSKNNNWYGWTSVPSLTGNTTTDPLFVDVKNNNVYLRPSSPAIDGGFS